MTYEMLAERASRDLFIIAEAGVNHGGSVTAAKALVDAAVNAGCDAVKFQTWITEQVYSPSLSNRPAYHAKHGGADLSEFDLIKRLELPFEAFADIKTYCDSRHIIFLSTADEQDSADLLIRLGVPLIKTASQDVTNLPYLRYLAAQGLPILFSTGGCTLPELIEGATAILDINPAIVAMHCVSAYPAPMEELNLNFIPVLSRLFDGVVGFSDHTVGTEAAAAAVALGARVIEKHVTLSRTLDGPDHEASLEPDELGAFVNSVRSVLQALGDGRKRLMPSEEDVSQSFRRFLVCVHRIERGHTFVPQDFRFKKIVRGIEPRHLDIVLRARAAKTIDAEAALDWNMLEFD